MTTVNEETFFVREATACAPVAGARSYSSFNALSFGAQQPLAANTTSEIVIPAGGLKDLAGNAIDKQTVVRFSTGAALAPATCKGSTGGGGTMGGQTGSDAGVGGTPGGSTGGSTGAGQVGGDGGQNAPGAPPVQRGTGGAPPPVTGTGGQGTAGMGGAGTDSRDTDSGCSTMPGHQAPRNLWLTLFGVVLIAQLARRTSWPGQKRCSKR
jgi:hypothetical protein